MTLYRETSCEQCSEPYGEHDGPVGDDCQGSGGSREEVTIDYEAAIAETSVWFGKYRRPDSASYAIVDAALHTERETVSTVIEPMEMTESERKFFVAAAGRD